MAVEGRLRISVVRDRLGAGTEPEPVIRRQGRLLQRQENDRLRGLFDREIAHQIACLPLLLVASPRADLEGRLLNGKGGLALDEIDAALTKGFSEYDVLRRDSDLENLRNHPEFRKVLEKHKVFTVK